MEAKLGNIMRTCELKKHGFYYKRIKQMLDSGEIEQVRRGFYRLQDEMSLSDVPVLQKLFPDGVICMESALDFYGYTDRVPSEWHLAVDSRSARARFKIDFPIVKPHFIKTDRYNVGITDAEIDGTRIKIYDKERTICDILLHRNKIDAEVFNTAIKRYAADNGKNIHNLIKYSQILHVEKKVREVLGIWL